MDDRAKFANYVSKLFIKEYSSIEEVVKNIHDVKKLNDFFEDHVRNVYELEEEIPLFNVYNLIINGADNYGWTQKEYDNKIKRAIIKLGKQYEKSKIN